MQSQTRAQGENTVVNAHTAQRPAKSQSRPQTSLDVPRTSCYYSERWMSWSVTRRPQDVPGTPADVLGTLCCVGGLGTDIFAHSQRSFRCWTAPWNGPPHWFLRCWPTNVPDGAHSAPFPTVQTSYRIVLHSGLELFEYSEQASRDILGSNNRSEPSARMKRVARLKRAARLKSGRFG